MPLLPAIEVSQELHDALLQQQSKTRESLQQLIPRLLAAELMGSDAEASKGDSACCKHTIWQTSTTGALIRGVFTSPVTVSDVLQHGNFGLGTLEGLDGEMIILDGKAYQCRGDGSVVEPDGSAAVPFATVTYFNADIKHTITQPIDSFATLVSIIDGMRPPEHKNQFCGIKITGTFKKMHVRMAVKVGKGIGLVEATHSQAEQEYENVTGTVVAFWSPQYAVAFTVPGFHSHWLGDDRQTGGHILAVEADAGLIVELHLEECFCCALPNSKEFNESELPADIAKALGEAEGGAHS